MLTKLATQFRRYAHTVGWVYRDSLRRFWRETLYLLCMRFIGIQCFVAVFGVVGYYANLIESNRPLELAGHTFQPRESIALLMLLSVVALLALSLAATCTYLANRGGLKLSLRYEEFCSKRLLALASGSTFFPEGKNPSLSKRQQLMTMAKAYARLCGRSYRMLVSGVVPSLIVLVIIVPLLLYLNFLLSVLILLLLIVSLTFHYRLNIRGAHHSLAKEQTSSEATLTYRNLLARAEHQPLPLKQQIIDEQFSNRSLRRNLRAYMGRVLARYNSQFVSDVFIAVSVVTILAVLGGSIIIQGAGWGTLIVYLLAMRFGLTHFKTLMAGLTGVNRFYHQLHQYFSFVEYSSQMHSSTNVPEVLSLAPSSSERLGESLERYEHRLGSRMAVLCVTPLNRFNLVGLAGNLTDLPEREMGSLMAGSAFISKDAQLPVGYTWREAMGLDAGQAWGAFLDTLGLGSHEPMLPSLELDQPITDRQNDGMPEAQRLLLALILAGARRKPWLWIEEAVVSTLWGYCQPVFDTMTRDKGVFITGEQVDRVGCYGEAAVAVLNEEALVGLGSVAWAKAHREQIEALLEHERGKVAALAGAQEEDDDELE